MARSLETLSLATLPIYDDRLERLVNAQIKRAVADCRDRPELEKVRKVTIQLEFIPVFENSVCDDVMFQVFVDDKHPPRRTKASRLGVNNANMLTFSPDNPEDINQPGLGFKGDNE